jgi:DNA-binding MarR family transcriptional regulator
MPKKTEENTAMTRKVPLGNWFSRILDAIRSETGLAMRPYGLDHLGFAILYHMALSGDGQTQAELTAYLFIDKAATSRTLDTLERNGYIERRISKADGRKKHIYLTAAGQGLKQTILDIYDGIYEQLIKGVPPREVERTLETLGKISANASDMGKE